MKENIEITEMCFNGSFKTRKVILEKYDESTELEFKLNKKLYDFQSERYKIEVYGIIMHPQTFCELMSSSKMGIYQIGYFESNKAISIFGSRVIRSTDVEVGEFFVF